MTDALRLSVRVSAGSRTRWPTLGRSGQTTLQIRHFERHEARWALAKTVFVHTRPHGGSFQSIVQPDRNDVLRPIRLPDIELAVRELFRARR